MMESHLQALHEKCEKLAQQIHEEMLHPAHDDLTVTRLKKLKLETEDEIERLQRQKTA